MKLRLVLGAAALAAGWIWAQPVETPEGYLGSLTPIMQSIQRERGYAFDYEHKGVSAWMHGASRAAVQWNARFPTRRSRFRWT